MALRKPKRRQSEQPPSTEPFPYQDYVRARQAFEAALRRGPFYMLLTGGSGTGKTSLKDDVRAGLDPHQQLLYLSATAKATSVGLARHLARCLRVPLKRFHLEIVADIVAALQGQPSLDVVVWLDEADQLPLTTLTELRGLVESNGQEHPLFSVVLSGLPELRTILDTPALFPLKRRLDVRCFLAGLRRDELEAFLLHRFGSVDSDRLSEETHDELFERTQATPALLGKVVAHALELAGDGKQVREEHIRAALDAFGL
jgi:type II secretory pathway predicted ATPase ExeA